jgi:hypothetical protein
MVGSVRVHRIGALIYCFKTYILNGELRWKQRIRLDIYDEKDKRALMNRQHLLPVILITIFDSCFHLHTIATDVLKVKH